MTEYIKPANLLLAALPDNDCKRFLLKSQVVSLTVAETIYEPGDIIHHVYFPISGMISLLTLVAEKNAMEVAVVGNEGMIGLPVFLGVETSINQVTVQGEGSALRIKTADFLKECESGGLLPKLLQRYTHALLTQVSQMVACNGFHQVEERLTCWLLLMHDRMKADKFRITQEFLSKMLGVRREAVNKSATNLQQQNFIAYSRGIVSIINRPALEAGACNCYAALKHEYEKMRGNLDRSSEK